MAKKKQKKATGEVQQYREGDLVGAQVKGHPVWPAFIEKVEPTKNGPKYTVRFFGSNDISQQCVKIKLFEDFTSKEKGCKKQGFQEALALCQAHYDPLGNAIHKEPESSPSAHSDPSLPTVQDATSIAPTITTLTITPKIKREPIEKAETKQIVEPKEREAKTDRKRSRAVAKISDESPRARDAKPTKYLKVSAKPELRTSRIEVSDKNVTRAESSSVHAEGENFKAAPDREKTIAKLKSKIDQKQEEKIALKKKRMEEKLIEKAKKAFENFSHANKFLGRLLPVARAVQKDQTNDQNVTQFLQMVQKLRSKLQVLSRSVMFTNSNMFSLDYSERFKFYEILTEVAVELKNIIASESALIELKKSANACRKQMKKDDIIKSFLNEDENTAARNKSILERRDNDANSGRIASKRRK